MGPGFCLATERGGRGRGASCARLRSAVFIDFDGRDGIVIVRGGNWMSSGTARRIFNWNKALSAYQLTANMMVLAYPRRGRLLFGP